MSRAAEQRIQQPLPVEEQIEQGIIGLTEHDGGIRRGYVPLDMINGDDVPVNTQNLNTIGTQLDEEAQAKGTDGQIQPIMLGMVAGREKLDIIDGFHRYTILKSRNSQTIYATIVEVSPEELLDKRIQNTANHSGLQFSRATLWVRQAWDLHPLSERISPTQAFTLGRIRSINGKRLGLAQDEVDDIMAWVDAKSALWGLEPITIYSYLHTHENIDARLVHNSRPSPQQAEGEYSLTQSTLNLIAKQIPRRPELQRAVAQVIVDNRLGGSGITGILSDIKRLSDEAAIEYLAGVDYSAYKEKIAQAPSFRYKEEDVLRLGQVRSSSRVRPLSEIAAVTTEHIDFVLEEGDYDPETIRQVGRQIGQVVTMLLSATQKIEAALSGDKKVAVENREMPVRPREVFVAELKTFLSDPGNGSFTITTEREAQIVERTLGRGRGTQQALAALEAVLAQYRQQAETL